MSEPKEQEWTMRVVDRIDRFYSRFFGEVGDAIEKKLLQDGWPTLATMQGIKSIMPTVHWPKDGKFYPNAKCIGGLLGHTVAHYEKMCDPRVWKIVCDGFNNLCDLLLDPQGDGERMAEDENPFVEALPQFRSAIASAMRYPSRQSVREQRLFFEGYTKALGKGSLTMTARGVGETTRTTAYQMIAACGPILGVHWRSVHDVHRFLVRMLGRQRAGDIKRTEGICNTIGLRFRNAGRPPSAK